MSSDVNSVQIKKTQDALNKYIKKPPLTEKLLNKPPFRFLHDIIKSIIKDTKFLDGLYTDDELNSENVKDKESKIAFLDKLIVALKLIDGVNITAKSAKIVAGLEVNKTLELLQTLGQALDNKVDTTDIVQRIVKKPVKYESSKLENLEEQQTAISENAKKSQIENEEKKMIINEQPTKPESKSTSSSSSKSRIPSTVQKENTTVITKGSKQPTTSSKVEETTVKKTTIGTKTTASSISKENPTKISKATADNSPKKKINNNNSNAERNKTEIKLKRNERSKDRSSVPVTNQPTKRDQKETSSKLLKSSSESRQVAKRSALPTPSSQQKSSATLNVGKSKQEEKKTEIKKNQEKIMAESKIENNAKIKTENKIKVDEKEEKAKVEEKKTKTEDEANDETKQKPAERRKANDSERENAEVEEKIKDEKIQTISSSLINDDNAVITTNEGNQIIKSANTAASTEIKQPTIIKQSTAERKDDDNRQQPPIKSESNVVNNEKAIDNDAENLKLDSINYSTETEVMKEPEKIKKRKESSSTTRPTSARPGSRKSHRNKTETETSTLTKNSAKTFISPLPSLATLPTQASPSSSSLSDVKRDPTSDSVSKRIPSARPKTASRPASARPGAPRIRDRGEIAITEEIKAPTTSVNVIEEGANDPVPDDKDDSVVIEEATQLPDTRSSETYDPSTPDTNQGQLVNQILETQKELEGDVTQPARRLDIEWEAGRTRERDMVAKEIDRIRDSVQTLTSSTNPLGKLIDYLQEDVDEMQRELQHWKKVNEDQQKQHQAELESRKQSLEPLRKQLDEIDNNIQMERQHLSRIKATIIGNDEKIIRLVNNINNNNNTKQSSGLRISR